jgi:hypothetical protein
MEYVRVLRIFFFERSVGVVTAEAFCRNTNLDSENYDKLGIKSLYVILENIPAEVILGVDAVANHHLWKLNLTPEGTEQIIDGLNFEVLEIKSDELLLDWRGKKAGEEDEEQEDSRRDRTQQWPVERIFAHRPIRAKNMKKFVTI